MPNVLARWPETAPKGHINVKGTYLFLRRSHKRVPLWVSDLPFDAVRLVARKPTNWIIYCSGQLRQFQNVRFI